MFARVAIDLALDRLFTYAVPEALEKKLAVGQLLSVPFGHREARGFVIELTDAAEDAAGAAMSFKVRPVTAIVDETPFFSPALLQLVRRLAHYSCAPLESVLKAALPASVLKKNARPRELLFVDPVPLPADLELTARQKWVCEQIARLGGGWLGSLCDELSTTPATLRTLAAKGALAIAPRERRRNPFTGCRILPSRPLKLNDEQTAALAAIRATVPPRPILLFGITGSGKTEVYLQTIAAELAAGRGAIVMVPEIALTPQTVQRFASRFGDQVAVLHSALSDGERYDEWHRIRSGKARVVVGPRSAVFAPVGSLGVIIVDEEHEPSYKQDELPRYHARDAAVLRGALEGARVVLGSATPSLESWQNVRRGKYALATMRRRAGAGTLPKVALVDRTHGALGESGGAIFSGELLEAIRLRLDRGEQTILFLNRRGYSRSVVCEVCGHVLGCPNCSTDENPLAYTYHRADSCLRCHVCGGWIPLPATCPACGASALSYRGVGTQRVEAALQRCFPRAKVLRMDADSTSRRHSHDDILTAFRRGEADILVGTQMIAKGLDFPNVTLVGVLNADTSLNQPDFRAGERTYQLLTQVAGRAGRAELPGEVFIQTGDSANSVLRLVAEEQGYERFAEAELKARAAANFPPYCHLAVVSLRAQEEQLVAGWAEMYAQSLTRYAAARKAGERGLLVGEAFPSALEKADGWHRWQIVLRSEKASELVASWRWISSVRPPPKTLRVSIDIDAQNLL